MSEFDKNNSNSRKSRKFAVGNTERLSSTSEMKEEIKRWKDFTKRSDAYEALAELEIVSPYLTNEKMHITDFYLLSRKVIQQYKVLKKRC
jgi:hypothetical protein